MSLHSLALHILTLMRLMCRQTVAAAATAVAAAAAAVVAVAVATAAAVVTITRATVGPSQ